jgi:hypothetical protein
MIGMNELGLLDIVIFFILLDGILYLEYKIIKEDYDKWLKEIG